MLSDYRRIVVKVGSSLLVDEESNLNREWLESLAEDVAALTKDGHELVIVSSGAIALGCSVLGISRARARLDDLQAAAAVGQIQLVHTYQEVLAGYNIRAAQVLMTPDDTEDRRRFLNARRTFGKLLDQSVVAIVNENDTVATTEIRYGDNDRLAARIAQLLMADAVILLSDVDGLYSSDPGISEAAVHIPEVTRIDAATTAVAGDSLSDTGSGGMATKVEAARIATRAGCATVVASGADRNPLQALLDGARHTIFRATGSPATARKQWFAGALELNGEMVVDDGAVHALGSGKSLLPVGVRSVTGSFRRGDVVGLKSLSGDEIGRGLAEYSDEEMRRLAGCQSSQIESTIGYRGRSVAMHRDDLVIFDDG